MTNPLLLAVLLLTAGTLVSGQDPHPMIYLALGIGPIITDPDTKILITDVGEDASGGLPSLTCHTDQTACCRSTETGMGGVGQWTYPDGSVLLNNAGSEAAGQQFYFVRNAPQLIRLARRDSNSPLSPTGSYCCTVPTTGGDMTLCANLVLCPSLSLDNGMVTYNDNTLGLNTVATHTCNPGYTLTTSTNTRTCRTNNDGEGLWSGTALICELPDYSCGSPPNVLNGFSRILTNSQTAEYSCNTGYTLSGSATVNCLVTERWSTPPSCIAVNCGPPPVPSNADVTLSTGTIYNSVATYTCDPCYVRMGVSFQICIETGNWVPMAPTCKILECGEPPSLVNGRVSLPHVTTCGSEVTYRCNIGYTLEGVSSRTCETNQQWSAGTIACKPVNCGDLYNPDNGRVVYSGSDFMSRATYSCNTGYQLTGANELTCQADGFWSSYRPSCEPVNCGPLRYPVNGAISRSSGNTFGSVAAYTCNTGYTLVGGRSRTCRANGQWSSVSPSCQVVDCGALPAPVNGAVNLRRGTTYNQYASYSCNEGYYLTGGSTRRCTATGEWTDSAPTCASVDCGGLEAPANGHVDTSQGTVFMNTAVYSCDPGYNLTGCSISECLATGSWSCDPPFCADNAIIQFKFGPTSYCVEWTNDKINLMYKTMHVVITKAVQKKGYDIPVKNIQQGYFSCYQSTTRTTYRTTITGTERLSAVDYTDMIQELVESGVTTRVLWYAIKMDKTCSVAVASMDQDECVE